MEVISELSSHITRPCFAHIKLEKIVGYFVNSYDGLLSVVSFQKEPHPADQKSVKKNVETSVKKDVEISVQKVEETDTGLVNHGLKTDVTASSPFRRRIDGRRPLRTHSCREPRSGNICLFFMTSMTSYWPLLSSILMSQSFHCFENLILCHPVTHCYKV